MEAEAQRHVEGAYGRLAPKVQQAQEQLQDLNTKVVKFVKKNPGMCLLGCLGLGFIVGRMVSR